MSNLAASMIFGGAILAIGVVASVIILEAIGHAKSDPESVGKQRKIHRILGWIFSISFIVLAITMYSRLRYWIGEPPSRVILHWMLSLAVVATFIAKIIVNRRYKKMSAHLPVLGWTLLICTFILLSISGGYNLIRVGGTDNLNPASKYAHALFERKCGHCHSLERAYKLPNDEKIIRGTVKRMQGYSPEWISDAEAEAIAMHIARTMKN